MKVIADSGPLKGCSVVIGRTVKGTSYSEKEGAGYVFKPLTFQEYSQYRKDRQAGVADPAISFAINPDDLWKAIALDKDFTFEDEQEFNRIKALMQRTI